MTAAPHWFRAAVLLLVCGLAPGSAGGQPPTRTTELRVEAESVLIRLIEQADVPALEAGVLAQVNVEEGTLVEQGDTLAQVDDTEALLLLQRAEIELAIARQEAADDAELQIATRTLVFAQAELSRARDAVEKYRQSVSQSELEDLQLAVERTGFEIAQARNKREVAQLLERLKSNEADTARARLARHRITSPLSGLVVELTRRRGEWVEPGAKLLRVVRLDRLRADGFVPVEALAHRLVGSPVEVVVDLPGRPRSTFSGRLTFVDPEVDPVNRQVRVSAEVANPELTLRPGLTARMTIVPAAQ